jgi:hypothetical protein
MIETQEEALRTALQLTVMSQDLGKLHFRLLTFPASLFNHSRPIKEKVFNLDMQAVYNHVSKLDILRPKYVDRHLCSRVPYDQ